MMRKIVAVWLVMLMVVGGMTGFMSGLINMGSASCETMSRSSSQSKSYTSHAPISINGNSQFTVANGVTGGYGTESDPYIIENWDINASSANGIYILNTDVYFIIRNCIIHDGGSNHYGIYFGNVQNSKIDNATSYNNYDGIRLLYSSNNNFTNCAVYNNSQYGIYLYYSSNNNIINCAVYNNPRDGIYLYSSSNNNKITNCAIYNNSYDGISLRYSSNNEAHYCNIYSNTNFGVWNYNSESQYIMDATYCWWGSASGPGGVGPSTGDNVTNNVLYDPWLTELVEGVGWTPPESGEEETIHGKEGKTEEGFNIFYLLGIGAAVATGIIVTVFLLRRRATIHKPEKPSPKSEIIAPNVSALTLHCPKCKKTFRVELKPKPFHVKCPHCGKQGTIGAQPKVEPLSTVKLRCPSCKKFFEIRKKGKPFNVKCPHCGKEGVIK